MKCRVVGVDIAGSELGDVLPEHKDAFLKAEQLGVKKTVHYGLPHRRLEVIVEELYADRIGHGYHISRDEGMLQYVKDRNLHLENTITVAVSINDFHIHKQISIVNFVENNMNISINTDDSTIKNIDLFDEYTLLRNSLYKYGRNEYTDDSILEIFKAINRRAIEDAFLRESELSIIRLWFQ